MVFEKYADQLYRCNRCRQCRYVTGKPLALIDPATGAPRENAVMPSCPSGFLNKFAAYYASGKLMVAKRILEGLHQIDKKTVEIFYACSLCGACDYQCSLNLADSESPNKLEFRPSEIFEEIREDLVNLGFRPMPNHIKFAESIRQNHNPYNESHKDRLVWAEGRNSKLPSNGNVIYFVGCTTAYRNPAIAKATVNIFERAGIEYGVLQSKGYSNEWCCGSPLLRTGQRKLAEEIMRHNVKAIEESGADTLVTSCAGCYATIKRDYAKVFKDLSFEVVHSSEFIQTLIRNGKLKPKQVDKKVTYHDPCHLGRHMGLYDAPREVLKAIPGIQFVEMPRTRKNAWCCGGGGGMMSGFPEMASKTADVRIQEAMDIGANAIVSTCPFCEVNLTKAAETFHRDVNIMDLAELLV
jgi:heterodisulfide reductase subunit D